MKLASAMTLSAENAVRRWRSSTMTLSDSRTIEKIGMRNRPISSETGISQAYVDDAARG